MRKWDACGSIEVSVGTLWKIIETCNILESFYNKILKIIAINSLLLVSKQTLITLGWQFNLRMFLPMSLVKPGTCPSKSMGLSHLDIFFFPRTDLADQLSPISLKFQDVILGFRIGLFILSSWDSGLVYSAGHSYIRPSIYLPSTLYPPTHLSMSNLFLSYIHGI